MDILKMNQVFTDWSDFTFDPGARRHTSFASVWVYPVIDDDIKINFDEKDLRIDTYRLAEQAGNMLIPPIAR